MWGTSWLKHSCSAEIHLELSINCDVSLDKVSATSAISILDLFVLLRAIVYHGAALPDLK